MSDYEEKIREALQEPGDLMAFTERGDWEQLLREHDNYRARFLETFDELRKVKAERDRLWAQVTKLIDRLVNPLIVVGKDSIPLLWSINQACDVNGDEAHGRGGSS